MGKWGGRGTPSTPNVGALGNLLIEIEENFKNDISC